jgi:hypothetical protein
MKKSLLLTGIAAFLFGMTAMAQEPQPTQKKVSNPTADSIAAKYKLVEMPSAMTVEQIFPVIGEYQSNSNADQKIRITLDEQNKGLVWIDGLQQGRIKAILKRSPAVYKIPAQKTAEGNSVMEGTLIYDKNAKSINIILGSSFNDQDPAAAFSASAQTDEVVAVTKTKNSKAKTKVKKIEPFTFAGTKIEQTTASAQ